MSTIQVALLLLFLIVPRTHFVGAQADVPRQFDTVSAGERHDTIAAALAAAADGDVIWILRGEHAGDVRVDKAVRIAGLALESRPRIAGRFDVAADGVTIEGLHFMPPATLAVAIEGRRDARLLRCRFTDLDVGVQLSACTNAVIDGCEFLRVDVPVSMVDGAGNLVRGSLFESSGKYAINVARSRGVVLSRNRLLRNSWVGIAIHSESRHARVSDCIIEGGCVGVSVQTDANVVEENTITGSVHGVLLGAGPLDRRGESHETAERIDVWRSPPPSITRNEVIRNTFREVRGEAVLLREAHGNRIAQNRIERGARHAVVLQDANENQIDENVGEDDRPAVLLVDSSRNRVTRNDGAGAVVIRGRENEVDRAADPAPRPDPIVHLGRRLVFGDFHTHSLLSDGSCAPDQILVYGRDVAGLDFVALSDHAEFLDESRWDELGASVRRHHERGSFVAIAGFECTFPMRWQGHYNAYFAGDAGRPHGTYDARNNLPNLEVLTPFDLLDVLGAEPEEVVVIRHHYMATVDYWRESPLAPRLLPMSEITSIHGTWSGDRAVDVSRVSRRREYAGDESTVRGGWDQGRVFGVGGGSDTHYGFPGDLGITALFVEDDSRRAIFDAIRARRAYATTGAPIIVLASLDGQPAGSELAPAEAPTLDLEVHGTAPLEEVVLFDNGSPWIPIDVEGATARASLLLPRRPADGSYLHVRVRQTDGELAWTSPFWIGPRPPARATPDELLDRRRASLLLAAFGLRAWPVIRNASLDGRTPLAAVSDATLRPRLEDLFVAYLDAAARVNRLGDELGLTTADEVRRIAKRYEGHWPGFQPAIARFVAPLVDVEDVRRRLGLDRG